MPIQVNIYSAKILDMMGHPTAITAEGATVGECLDDLVRQYPDIRELIFTAVNRLRRGVYVFVNAESLHKVEMSRPLRPTDVLIIAVMISGG